MKLTRYECLEIFNYLLSYAKECNEASELSTVTATNFPVQYYIYWNPIEKKLGVHNTASGDYTGQVLFYRYEDAMNLINGNEYVTVDELIGFCTLGVEEWKRETN